MSVIRMIFVKVGPDKADDAERVWNRHCAPLMIKQPGCLSEKLLRCVDDPSEFISYSEWDDEESIERYRKSDAHEEIKKHARPLSGERLVVKRYRLEGGLR